MSERRHPGHAGPIRGPGSDDLLAEADRAERAGDAFAAALALRRHLDRRPDDTGARLRYARFLLGSGERVAARQALETLSRGQPPGELRSRLDRLLAELDEADGLLSSAAERWERLLADDLDDPEARARLARWVRSGELSFDVVRVALSEIETAWRRTDLQGRRLVVMP